MKYLGIDYGTKKIGVAVSDDGGSLAFPLTTVKAGSSALVDVVALINKHEVEAVVLGESRNLQGEPNEVMKDIEQFKKDLAELSLLPVHYEQEFFSSAQAARQFAPQLSSDGRGSRKKNVSQEKLDAAAAALILQSYLDRLKNNG